MAKRQRQNVAPTMTKTPATPIKGAEQREIGINKGLLYLLLLVTATVYARAALNGLTNFDDDFYINNNPYLRNFNWKGVVAIFSSFYTANYHPLTTLTYLLEFHYFELNPLPYHLLNIALHLLNVWLVFQVILQLCGKRFVALFTAALFALHPMHVESVAWVSERKDVLYTAFYLTSYWLYLKYSGVHKSMGLYFATLLAFCCALLSKSAAVTLPVLLVATDIYKNRQFTAKPILEKVPFFALATIFGVVNILAQKAGGSINNMIGSFGWINRSCLILYGPVYYLFQLFFPASLSAMHFFPPPTTGLMPWQYYLGAPGLALAVMLVLWRTKWRREAIFGFSFYMITLSVMLQIVSFGSAVVAERYTYVPYIGLFFTLGTVLSHLAAPENRRIPVYTAGLAALLAFSALTYQRIGVWKDGLTLFDDVVEQYPNVYVGYWLRGNLQREAGNLNSALDNYAKAISLNPADGDSYYNRGKIFDELGNPKAAIPDYSKAIALNPKLPDAYNNRGWARFETGDTAGAIVDFDTAISIKPNYAEAFNNRGWVRQRGGNPEAAVADYTAAISADPKFIKPKYNRAAINMLTGNMTQALADYNSIITLDSAAANAYFYRAQARIMLGDTLNACPDLHRAAEMGIGESNALLKQFCR